MGSSSRGGTIRDITLGVAIGLGIGLMALAGILLLARPWEVLAPQATPMPSPQAEVAEAAPATATPVPKPTATLRPVSPTPAPGEQPRFIEHTVVEGDSLLGLAVRYDVSVDAIMAANPIIEDPDQLGLGWVLQIPIGAGLAVTPSPGAASTPEPKAVGTAEGHASGPWQPFPLEENIEAVYSQALEGDRFTLHYAPDTPPAENPQAVAALVSAGLAHLETQTGARLDDHFDVYAAGDLFSPPDQALRGHSFSASLRFYVLFDGSGDAAERQYMVTHELAHLFAWNVFGRPVSAMLSEGFAVAMGASQIEGNSDQLPIGQFCALYHQAGDLPRVTSRLSFEGHTLDLPNYYAAGCFVQYLLETDGAEHFAELYPSGDFQGVYGQTLAQLEAAWLEEVAATEVPAGLSGADLVAAVHDVGQTSEAFFSSFSGTEAQRAAYWEFDAARLALLAGQLDEVESHLAAAEALSP